MNSPSVKYTDEFLRIAEYVEKTGEYFLNINNVWGKLRIPQDPIESEYKEIRGLIPEGEGYSHSMTNNSDRVLVLLFLHAILSSGDSVK